MKTILMQSSRSQRIGALVLLALLLFALFEGLLHQGSSVKQNLSLYLTPPSWDAWLGTDQFGRSMLARMGAAIRLSFTLSFICVLTSATLGTLLGVLAAWRGGWVDRSLGFLVNTLLALPGLVLILLFAAIAPGSFLVLYLAISLVLWVEYYRVVRAVTLTVVTGPQLQSSMLLGFGRVYLFRRHIWPAVKPSVLTLAAFGAANSILALASIGFIYVGLKPPVAELGLMVVELLPYYSEAPWVIAQPLAAIFLLVLGFNLLAGKAS